MGHKRIGKSVRRNRQVKEGESKSTVEAPHSFVIHRGEVGKYVLELTKNFRKVMEPFTASSIKARKKNSIKDFVSVSGILHVSHLCMFTHTEVGTYLKIARFPKGPTLTFRVHNYTLARDVLSSMKKPFVFEQQFKNSPLVVLNSFSGEGMHLKLMASMFQNMFPTINIADINLNNIRRCVLLNYNPTSKLVDFRHYAIQVVPVGLSKSVKKIIKSKVPNLGRYNDISEFLTKPGQLSESEMEDDPASHILLSQRLKSRGNLEGNKSSIRLIEIGPRLTLQLIKVEDGLLNGKVLFHEFIHKTQEEVNAIEKHRNEQLLLKSTRKRIQEENKKKKEQKKEFLKQKALKGMGKKKLEGDRLMQIAAKESNEAQVVQDETVDDAEWYRQEVGEEPEKGLFDPTSAPQVNDKRKAPFGLRARKIAKLEKMAEDPEFFAKEQRKKDQKKKDQKKKDLASEDNFNKKKFKKGKVLGSKVSKKYRK